MRRVDAAEVYYIESDGHRINFYTENGDFSAPGTLKTWEEKLENSAFVRCNSGYLVNLAHVVPACSRTRCRLARMSADQPPQAPNWRFLAALADYYRGWRRMILPDIPRLYTALRKSGRVLYCASRAVPHGKAGVLGHYGGLRRTAAAFLYLTGDVPLLWWIPCMAAAIVWIYLYLLATRELNLLEAGYCCARAFIVAEFAASVEWQFHCGIWPQRGAWEPLSLLLLAVVTAST